MLAGAAGYVNALGWTTSNVFPGVMSGNTILLGLAIDHRFRASATLAACTIAGFAGGARSPRGFSGAYRAGAPSPPQRSFCLPPLC